MILGDFNVTLNFSRDTYNYLTDPHKNARIKINQWLYNADFTDVYDELHPGKSSYTWSKSAEIGIGREVNVLDCKQQIISIIYILLIIFHNIIIRIIEPTSLPWENNNPVWIKWYLLFYII